MKITQKFIIGLMAVLIIFSGQVSTPVSASTQDHAELTATERSELIKVLLKQIEILQEMLRTQIAKEAKAKATETSEGVGPVTSADYTKGSLKAEKQIVTFTDFDCPFCHRFHTTLNDLLKTRSDISVTYRHFPIVQLHPNAMQLATAAECAGSLGGDVAYWEFVDSMFASRTTSEGTDLSLLDTFAKEAGLSLTKFKQCQKGNSASTAVEQDIAEGTEGGVRGTPSSFVFVDGKMVKEINGAQPISAVEKILSEI